MNTEDKDKRWGIIYCPRKGRGSPLKRWRKIERALHDNDIRFDFIQSESVGSVSRLVGMLMDNGYKTIIIVGGDTALNDAVNCLMNADKEVRDATAIGIIPNGLMNDFAHFWGFAGQDDEHIVAWLKQRRTRRVDVGRLDYTTNDGTAASQYFINCVNVGLIATIMDLRRKTRHALGSRSLSLLASFILMLFQRLDYRMHIKINASDIRRSNIMTMCIGNSTGYGQTPSAVPYNGWLDVSVVSNPKITQLIAGFYLLLRGRVLNHRSVRAYRTRQVDVIDAPHAMVSIDGMPVDALATPFTVTVIPEQINFIIPE